MHADDILRIAIIGCGAVTELAHLPAARRVSGCRITLLVDPNASRREQMAKTFGVEETASDIDTCLDRFDAAIVAAPHATHAPITIDLSSRGKSVLVEKPMATSTRDCQAMIEAARRNGVTLAVGLMRRFLWGHRFAREAIRTEAFGRVRSFSFSEGAIYFWPVASDSLFRKETAGGGVLVDTGAHTLDCLLEWLGPVSELEYFDDAEGGVEANCLLRLRMQSGAEGTVELSRTRHLRNTARIEMERGVLEIALAENRIKVSLPNQPFATGGTVADATEPEREQDYLSIMAEQMQDWVDATRARRPPLVDGPSALESVRLIEACYAKKQPLVLPWDTADAYRFSETAK